MARKRRGLSLLEIVAIVLIVLVLAAILWPVSTGGVRTARRTACLSNLKMAGIATQMYAADWDDRLQPASNWADASMPYLKNKETLRCPGIIPSFADSKRAGVFGHAFRNAFGGRKIATFEAHHDEILIFDSSDLSWNANGDLWLLPNPGRYPGDSNNVLFVDGHAKRITRETLIRDYLTAARGPNHG